MKMQQLILLLLLNLCIVTSCLAKEQGNWHALVIGIGDYQDKRIPALRTPVPDGRALTEVLRTSYSFQVTTLFDKEASWTGIDRELRRLVTEAGENDSVLIYYGGHGDQDQELGEGWWYPADAVPGKRQTYLQNSELRELIKQMKARHVLVVSDSCFASSLFGKYRSLHAKIDDRYHQRLYLSKSRLGLTSGGNEPVLDGGSEGHSIFAYHLLKYLKNSDRDVFSAGELFTDIAPVVTNNSPQKPEFLPLLYTGHESGEFIFVRAGADIITYVSSVDVKKKSAGERPAPPQLPMLWWIVGVGAAAVTVVALLVPRMSRNRREEQLRLALDERDCVRVDGLLAKGDPRDGGLAASIRLLQASANGVVLKGVRGETGLAPGPRQGLGRGPQWLLNIADPHISRKSHAWLSLGEEGVSLSADGGEVLVNGEKTQVAILKAGDTIGLGPATELKVERCVAGIGLLLVVTAGPMQGKRLVVFAAGLPLSWLADNHGGHVSYGRLSWREAKPWLDISEGDDHPLPEKSTLDSFPLLDGDMLRLGENDWVVQRV